MNPSNEITSRSPVPLLIMEKIEETPGISLKELVDATGRPKRTVYYHVRKLRQKHRILVQKNGNKHHFFLAKEYDLLRARSRLINNHPIAEQINAYLDKHGSSNSVNELATVIDQGWHATNRIIATLSDHGVVDVVEENGRRRIKKHDPTHTNIF